jgi:adenine-specific DNA methylase
MKGHSIAGMSTERDRVDDDYYATPPEATQVLLDNFDLSYCQTFLEPSCGEGHISKILENNFKESEVFSNDLIDRGYGFAPRNFLTYNHVDKFDCIITNPPFKIAKEFIERALTISNKYVIMFAKIQLLEGIGRKELFEKNPPKYIYVFRNRINPLRNGNPLDEKGKPWSSTMCFAWFVWEIGFTGEPTIRWLQTNKKDGVLSTKGETQVERMKHIQKNKTLNSIPYYHKYVLQM